jgi:hypothetical protein
MRLLIALLTLGYALWTPVLGAQSKAKACPDRLHSSGRASASARAASAGSRAHRIHRVLSKSEYFVAEQDRMGNDFSIHASVQDATLEFGIETKVESRGKVYRAPTLYGAEQFSAMLEHFEKKGTAVGTILSRWSYGDNLKTFNQSTQSVSIDDGIALEAAAFKTWTGTQALAHGFDRVELLELTGRPGAFCRVVAAFTKTQPENDGDLEP